MMLHADCVDFDGAGVLISGKSGSGKSDLALRLIEAGAVLVADDCVETVVENGETEACAPEEMRGLLEVRGLGIVQMPFKEKTVIQLKVCLCSFDEIDRMPSSFVDAVAYGALPELHLNAFEASAVIKIKTALAVIAGKSDLVT